MITLESATSQLVADGAVLHVWNSPLRCFLVGQLEWIDARRLFWFTAHGDREDDGHVLEFDSAEVVDGQGVNFFRGGARVARLSTISMSAVDDREDYTVAFSLWQQVEPCTRPLIARVRAKYERAAALDGQ